MEELLSPLINYQLLVTHRGTLLMKTDLLHDIFANFSMRGERYFFCVEGSA